ncbi:MAG: 50S ribosomal protein L18 [Candidatus Dadabacteria bacterium]|nr:50S ribosomal protein L18 [Candidatus Dadabacteria bacterium]NIS08364.1 50S ribosomal protein L18 [Candidatus Dadabacteria bacterium]NIV42225.1 50S ribosomal protein L18 [Candidatus Dadabacteria bacterium]NIX16402.1 50S ribosomal protein L18 [Candidatus Dadabacteria bacterium]NIY21881.1 50S ribosomal protein L18 [Candidatus Dadabacteria bacterium]
MIKLKSRKSMKDLRHRRVRKKVAGNAQTPRLSVFKSLQNIYAQVIDDTAHNTLFSCSTLTPKLLEQIKKDNMKKTDAAKIVGQEIAAKCLDKGIKSVRFDRGGFPYTGRVKSLADGAREQGLKF